MASAALASVEYLRKVPGPFFNQSPNDGAALMKRFVEEANKYDFYREEWFRHRRSGFTTLITKIKSRVSVCKYMLTDIETYPGHPAPFTIPDQPIYAGHPLLPNTKSFDGFILGMITDPLQFDRQQGCTVGDGFVIGPNGTRCGLTWEVLDDGSQPGFATLEKANGARWGVYHFFVTKPLANMTDLIQMWTGMLPVFRMLYKRAYPNAVLPQPPQQQQQQPSQPSPSPQLLQMQQQQQMQQQPQPPPSLPLPQTIQPQLLHQMSQPQPPPPLPLPTILPSIPQPPPPLPMPFLQSSPSPSSSSDPSVTNE